MYEIEEHITILGVGQEDDRSFFVEFSDGTSALFTVKQLLKLAPDRSGSEKIPPFEPTAIM